MKRSLSGVQEGEFSHCVDKMLGLTLDGGVLIVRLIFANLNIPFSFSLMLQLVLDIINLVLFEVLWGGGVAV